jgi:hypothetical protein
MTIILPHFRPEDESHGEHPQPDASHSEVDFP